MNRFDIILRAGELLDDLAPEIDIDERAIKYLKECMSRCAALDEAQKIKNACYHDKRHEYRHCT